MNDFKELKIKNNTTLLSWLSNSVLDLTDYTICVEVNDRPYYTYELEGILKLKIPDLDKLKIEKIKINFLFKLVYFYVY